MFDYLLDKLQKADVQVYPYKWIYIENFLKALEQKKMALTVLISKKRF